MFVLGRAVEQQTKEGSTTLKPKQYKKADFKRVNECGAHKKLSLSDDIMNGAGRDGLRQLAKGKGGIYRLVLCRLCTA